MIDKIKAVTPYQWAIGLLVSVILFLAGLGYTETCKKFDSKASNESVQNVLNVVNMQQKAAVIRDKEQAEERERTRIKDEELLRILQNLRIQTAVNTEKLKD